MKTQTKCSKAFTLTEVLITLTIIGIVAALIIPTVNKNIQAKIKHERQRNIMAKISKSTDKMVALDVMIGYSSTQAFINELQKHMKLSKICKNDNIADCWPTASITLDTQNINISDISSGGNFGLSDDDKNSWDDTMGFVTADGTSYIVSYNKKCSINTNNTSLVTSSETMESNSTKCLAGIYDWNGNSKPNKYKEDIETFGSAISLSNCQAIVGDLCITIKATTASPITRSECLDIKSSLNFKSCAPDGINDYWGGAIAKCGGADKLFDHNDFKKLAEYIYNDDGTFNSEKANPLGIKIGTYFSYSGYNYSSNNDTDDAPVCYFKQNGFGCTQLSGTRRSNATAYFLCKK